MGVVNVTPDSFSDGGRFLEPARAIEHGLELLAQGADLLDIGGESSRPGALGLEPAEELRRVLPVVAGLRERTRVPLSIDTVHAEVARQALEAGATIVNDISAGRADAGMLALVASRAAGFVAMHMQGSPRDMQRDPRYADVVAEVREFLRERSGAAFAAGIAREQVWIDPGIGFGKTLEHNLTLLRRLGETAPADVPIVVGVSRKGFLGVITGRAVHERDPASIAAALRSVDRGARVLRVHDVRGTVDALTVWSRLQPTR